MKRLFLSAIVLISCVEISRAGALFDSANIATGTATSAPAPLGNMGLAGIFNFYAATTTGGKSNPPLVIGSTIGVYAPGNLGVEVATVTGRTWMRTASMTVTGYGIISTKFYGDGSGLFNLSTGGVVNQIGLYVATTSIFNQLASTGVSLSQLWSSALSSFTALNSTGVAFGIFQPSANSTMTALSISTAANFSNLKSTGVSLSQNWASTLSTYTALTSTGIFLSNFYASVASTQSILSASTATLALATAALQSVQAAISLSTTTLGLSTATLKARIDTFSIANATVQVRIDQLQIFVSTAQGIINAVSIATSATAFRVSSGAITVYDHGVLRGNITTISLGSNLTSSINQSTLTLVAITTNGSLGSSLVSVLVDNANQLLISSMNFPSSEFLTSAEGSSVTFTISGTTHIWTAIQTFSSATATSLTVLGNTYGDGTAIFNGQITGNAGIVSLNNSTYPFVDLTASNRVWRLTTRDAPNTSRKLFILTDATNGYERMQIDPSSGNMIVGGNITSGLNGFVPTSAKFTVVGGSLAVVGSSAAIFCQGLIQTTSGFVFPDGTIQTSSGVAVTLFVGVIFDTNTAKGPGSIYFATHTWTASQTLYSASFTVIAPSGGNGDLVVSVASTTANVSNASPALRFEGSYDANGSATGVQLATSAARLLLSPDNTASPTENSFRMALLDNRGTERFSFGHKGGLGIANTAINTGTDLFDIGTTTFVVKQNGFIGLNTANPNTALEVNQGTISALTIAATNFIFPDGSIQTTALISALTSSPTWTGAHNFKGSSTTFSTPVVFNSVNSILVKESTMAIIHAFSFNANATPTFQINDQRTAVGAVDQVRFKIGPGAHTGGQRDKDMLIGQYFAAYESIGTPTGGSPAIVIGSTYATSLLDITGGSVTIRARPSYSPYTAWDAVAGGMSAGYYTVNGAALFTSSFSAHAFDGFTLWAGSLTVGGMQTNNSTITVSLPGITDIKIPMFSVTDSTQVYSFANSNSLPSIWMQTWKSSFTFINRANTDNGTRPLAENINWTVFAK